MDLIELRILILKCKRALFQLKWINRLRCLLSASIFFVLVWIDVHHTIDSYLPRQTQPNRSILNSKYCELLMTGHLHIQYWTIIGTFWSQQRINSNTHNRWIQGATSFYEAYSYWRRNAILHVWTHTNTAIITTHEQLEHDFSVNVTKKQNYQGNEQTNRSFANRVICVLVRWKEMASVTTTSLSFALVLWSLASHYHNCDNRSLIL